MRRLDPRHRVRGAVAVANARAARRRTTPRGRAAGTPRRSSRGAARRRPSSYSAGRISAGVCSATCTCYASTTTWRKVARKKGGGAFTGSWSTPGAVFAPASFTAEEPPRRRVFPRRGVRLRRRRERRRGERGAFYSFTLVLIRPRSRGERRSLRTFLPGVSLRPGSLDGFNPRPRRLSTPLLTPLNSTPTFALYERPRRTRSSPSTSTSWRGARSRRAGIPRARGSAPPRS